MSSTGPMGLNSSNGETGNPPGCNRHSIESTGITWIEPANGDELWRVTCPGCRRTWESPVDRGGFARSKYWNHDCDSPELPRKLGRGATKSRTFDEGELRSYLMNLHMRDDDTPPMDGTRNIADEFDMTIKDTRRQLERLEDDGMLGKQKVGNDYVWWLSDFNW